VVRHMHDDAGFHASESFQATVRDVAALLGPVRAVHPQLRPRFVGHVLTEVLLDAELLRADPTLTERYYTALRTLEPKEVEHVAARLTPAAPRGLARLVTGFVDARVVEEYAYDECVARRLDQTFARVRQPAIGPALLPLLPQARALVAERAASLLV
jgi:hypothetical protein